MVAFRLRMSALVALLLSLLMGCNNGTPPTNTTAMKTNDGPEANNAEKIIDLTQPGNYVIVGRFEQLDGKQMRRVGALTIDEVRPIVERHADRSESGALIRGTPPRDGKGVTLGFVEDNPIVLRREGDVIIPWTRSGKRFDLFLWEFMKELDCVSYVETVP